MSMKVALASYPMLWQRSGGLQVQILQTKEALISCGYDAKIFNPNTDLIRDFDVFHVFGLLSGNHRLVEAARQNGVPVVVSTVQHVYSRSDMLRARIASAITGKLTSWQFSTSYDHIRFGLHNANAVIALGDIEKDFLSYGYDVCDDLIHVIPNGISDVFFRSTPEIFLRVSSLRAPFILHVSSITPYKNPLVSAKISKALDVPLVLIGDCPPGYEKYLNECRNNCGKEIIYLGKLDPNSELLASAYAAASVLLLPSVSEVMPLVVLESLASGTPVVMTKDSALELPGEEVCVQKIAVDDFVGMSEAVNFFMNSRVEENECKDLVKHLRWDRIAFELGAVYRSITN